MKILVAEDDIQLSGFIKQALLEDGHTVHLAHDGDEAWFLIGTEPFDLVVLDILMPKRSGLDVLQKIRQSHFSNPVLFLTALDRVSDKVKGLDLGADDYLTKPFALAELKARIRALGRRKSALIENQLQCGNIVIHRLTHQVFRDGSEIRLTAKEFTLLEYLMTHKNEVVNRTEILETVWEVNFDTYSDVVKVLVSRIRKKLELENDAPLIHTVRGVGYIMKEQERAC